MNYKTAFNGLLVLNLTCVAFLLFMSFDHLPSQLTFSVCKCNLTDQDPDPVLDIFKYLKQARTHAKGMKTQNLLTNAIRQAESYLHARGISFSKVVKRKSYSYKFVCPEIFTSIEHDFPRYENNYIIEKCSYAQPMKSFLTITLIWTSNDFLPLKQLIHDINSLKVNVSVLVGIVSDVNNATRHILDKFNNVKVTVFKKETTVGKMWNALMSSVHTEFVLIGRGLRYFSNDSNLYRLVREIQRLNVKAIGGSTINNENHWHVGCHQRAFRNFSLVFQEGYDESFHDCLFCDHVDGPFLIRTKDIKNVKFDEKLEVMGLFEDFFMRLGSESAICPDSMFYVNTHSLKRSENTVAWRKFGNKLNLYKLKFSSGILINFGCSHSYSCPKRKGYVHSPCCIQELTRLINDVDKICYANNIFCEINCGNLVGAIKLSSSLPWELDADDRIYYRNVTAFKKLKVGIEKMGYKFKDVGSVSLLDCSNRSERVVGVVDITSKHWVLTMYSFCYNPSVSSKSKGLNLTFVSNNGHFAVAPRNPALYIRNKYAFEPFAHVQHYSLISKSSVDIRTPSTFTQCKTPGRQDCLDLYSTDGNVQFQDLIP